MVQDDVAEANASAASAAQTQAFSRTKSAESTTSWDRIESGCPSVSACSSWHRFRPMLLS